MRNWIYCKDVGFKKVLAKKYLKKTPDSYSSVTKLSPTESLPRALTGFNSGSRTLGRVCRAVDAALSFTDTTLAAETCEELFTPRAPHITLALNGIEIITNGSGSHHQLRWKK